MPRLALLGCILLVASACDSASDTKSEQKTAKAPGEVEGKSAKAPAEPAKQDEKPDPPPAEPPTPPADSPTTSIGDPVPPEAHVCERYGRGRIGHEWTFQRKPVVVGEPTSSEDSGYRVESYDPSAKKLRMHHKRTTNMIQTVAVTDFYEEYRCDEQGMWFVTSDATGTMTAASDGRSWPTRQSTVYDPPMLLLPPALEVGTKWQSKSTQRHTASSSSGPDTVTNTEMDRTCEVVLKEKITVPAGTYDTFRVDCTPAGGGAKASIWYVEGVGAVKFGENGPKLMLHRPPG